MKMKELGAGASLAHRLDQPLKKGVNVMTLEKLYAVVMLTPDEPFRRFDGRIESGVASDPFLF